MSDDARTPSTDGPCVTDRIRPRSPVAADPASPVRESRRGSGGVDELTDLVRDNLLRMIKADGRTNTELAAEAWPDVVPATGRKMVARALERGWLRPEDADGLMVALSAEHLAEFYLPAEPELTELRVRRIRLRAAAKAAQSAAASLRAAKTEVRAELFDTGPGGDLWTGDGRPKIVAGADGRLSLGGLVTTMSVARSVDGWWELRHDTNGHIGDADSKRLAIALAAGIIRNAVTRGLVADSRPT